MNWSIVHSREFFSVKQCNLCGRFGHTGRNCNFKDAGPTCLRCSGEHVSAGCNAPFKCVNCTYLNSKFRTNFNPGHSCRNRTCFSYLRQISRIARMTDYDCSR